MTDEIGFLSAPPQLIHGNSRTSRPFSCADKWCSVRRRVASGTRRYDLGGAEPAYVYRKTDGIKPPYSASSSVSNGGTTMKLPRRQLFRLAGAATALFASPYVVRAQAQSPNVSVKPQGSARDRLEEALARIGDPKGEGPRACLTVYSQAARNAADAADARARTGINLGPLDGAIVTIKDLFDVAGEPTRAGSKVLVDAPPASIDAPVVRRLRAGGAVIVAKTNMVEFAFSGIGVNPHYGTPGNLGGPHACSRRLLIGRGGSRCGRHVRDRHWHRYWRFDPRSRCALWRGRIQADQITGADRRRVSAVLHARFSWADRAKRRGVRRR